MEGNRPWGKLRTRWIDPIRKDIEMRGKNWEEIQINRKWENRDLSAIVNTYLWKLLNNDDDISLHSLGYPQTILYLVQRFRNGTWSQKNCPCS